MKYFRKADLIKIYGISDKTIRNWIEGALQGKIALELYEGSGKTYIADSLKNSSILEELVLRSRKYRNKRSHQIVKPTQEFYSLFNDQQVDEVIRSLEVYKEFPQHFRFRGEGALYFDAYLHKLYKAGKSNHLTASTKLININLSYLDFLIASSHYDRINIIDLGVGNGLASIELLRHYVEIKKPLKYIGIDISPELLDITEQNIRNRFKDKVKVEKHVKDITTESLYTRSAHSGDSKTLNIFLLLGGVIINFRKPEKALQVISNSMGRDDLLLTTTKLDNKESRAFFDFNVESDVTNLPRHNKYVLELLNISDTCYEVEQFFSPSTRCRYIQIRLRIALTVHFSYKDFDKKVHFRKGDVILLWQAQHYTANELVSLFQRMGFTTMQTTKSEDEAFVMMISRLIPVENHITPAN